MFAKKDKFGNATVMNQFSTNHLSLYQINVRQFLTGLGVGKKIIDIPVSFWLHLKDRGITAVWLMGVWQLPPRDIILKYAATELMIDEYRKVLPSVTEQDICGSIFAIDRYQIDSELGDEQAVLELKHTLNSLGMLLILDFIPNHFHIESSLLTTNPEIFLYDSNNRANNQVLCGKDPHFPQWADTAQLDYSQQVTRQFMQNQLLNIVNLCDGVRCDMSMLVIKDVFMQTWKDMLTDENIVAWHDDFWIETISLIRISYPKFCCIAEVYWGLEERLLTLGFDYVYDKEFLDTVLKKDLTQVVDYVSSRDMRQRLVFLENHDEDRITSRLAGNDLYQAILIHNQMPIKLFQHGQLEGQTHRFPVQLKSTNFSKLGTDSTRLYNSLFTLA